MFQDVIVLIIVGITVASVIFKVFRPLFAADGNKTGIHSCGGCDTDCSFKK
ncbi:MAG: hypothetical protein NTW49_08495 [Bacteroidia bacterium]|nr:hypothetical protein [Bacteroidia bacterium]